MSVKSLTFKIVFVGALLIVLFSYQGLQAQSTIVGKISDQNNEPIPYAHVRLENTNIGTISNSSGAFKLVVPSESKYKRLIISSMGYITARISWDSKYQNISLQEDVNLLSKVIIVSKDYAKELVEKAIEAIPNNYPASSERHTGFLRESTTWENKKKPIYIAETVIESIKEGYGKKYRSGDVKVLEFRKYESTSLDSLDLRIYAGSHHIHRFDIVSRRDAFLSKPDGYSYRITDTLRQNGNNIFKVLIEQNDENSAHIYIEEGTYAIVRADITLNSNFGGIMAGREFFKYTVTYERGEDKKWRFMNSYYKTAFKQQGKILNLTSEYVTTDVSQDSTTIPYLERIGFSEILLDDTTQYNSDFWSDYTIIAPDNLSESLFRSIDYTIRDKDDKRSDGIPKFIKRMSMEIGLSWTQLDIAATTVNYTNSPIAIQQSDEEGTKNSIVLASTLFYEITPYFVVGYANESKITRTGTTSNDLLVAGKFNLNPKGRPIRISPRFHFGYQEIETFLEQIELQEDVRIDGRRINEGTVNTFLSERGFRFKTVLGLSVEQSKRVSFLIAAGYTIPLNTKQGLVFREGFTSTVFPRKVFVENGQENLAIQTNQDNIIANTLNIQAGIVYRF